MIIRKMVKSTNVLAFIVNRILMFVLVGYLYYLIKDRWKYIFIYSDSLGMDCYVLLLYI